MYTIEKAFCICVCAAWPHHHLYKSETFGSVSGLVITTPPQQFSVKLSRQTINNEHLTLSQWKSWISLIKIESNCIELIKRFAMHSIIKILNPVICVRCSLNSLSKFNFSFDSNDILYILISVYGSWILHPLKSYILITCRALLCFLSSINDI